MNLKEAKQIITTSKECGFFSNFDFMDCLNTLEVCATLRQRYYMENEPALLHQYSELVRAIMVVGADLWKQMTTKNKETDIDRLQKELDEQLKINQAGQERELKLIRQNTKLKEKLKLLEDDVSKIEKDKRELQSQLDRRKSTALETTEALHTEIDSLTKQLNKMEDRYVRAACQITEMEEELEATKSQLQELRDRLQRVCKDDEAIGDLVNEIAYRQHHEEQAEDFLEKVWLVKEFLEKVFSAAPKEKNETI